MLTKKEGNTSWSDDLNVKYELNASTGWKHSKSKSVMATASGQTPRGDKRTTWSSKSTHNYYMASSVGVQSEPNLALRLITRAGKIALCCRLGITRCVPQENFFRNSLFWCPLSHTFRCLGHYVPRGTRGCIYNRSFIDQVWSAKMAG